MRLNVRLNVIFEANLSARFVFVCIFFFSCNNPSQRFAPAIDFKYFFFFFFFTFLCMQGGRYVQDFVNIFLFQSKSLRMFEFSLQRCLFQNGVWRKAA